MPLEPGFAGAVVEIEVRRDRTPVPTLRWVCVGPTDALVSYGDVYIAAEQIATLTEDSQSECVAVGIRLTESPPREMDIPAEQRLPKNAKAARIQVHLTVPVLFEAVVKFDGHETIDDTIVAARMHAIREVSDALFVVPGVLSTKITRAEKIEWEAIKPKTGGKG